MSLLSNFERGLNDRRLGSLQKPGVPASLECQGAMSMDGPACGKHCWELQPASSLCTTMPLCWENGTLE